MEGVKLQRPFSLFVVGYHVIADEGLPSRESLAF